MKECSLFHLCADIFLYTLVVVHNFIFWKSLSPLLVADYNIELGLNVNIIVAIVAQLCEHTKNHLIIHFKLVNCVAYELQLNKTLRKSQ